MENLVMMCQGIEEINLCSDCRRKKLKVEFMKSYYYPPINVSTEQCNFYWPSTDWQDPNRDDVIATNGNVGYEGDF